MINKSIFKNQSQAMICCIFLCISCISFSQKPTEVQSNNKIEIVQKDAIKALIIKTEAPSSSIEQSMGSAYSKLFACLKMNGVKPIGPPFSVYYSYDPNGNTVFESGIPIDTDIKVEGELKIKEYPSVKAVTTLYVGAYKNMMPVYQTLQNYMAENNLKPLGISWEVYFTDPNTTKNPDDNKTGIYFPIHEK